MKLKGIIDCDFNNYKDPVLTLEMPICDFKCDRLNHCLVCQNSQLANEPDIDVSFEKIWELYQANPLTKGFCLQGLEPLDSYSDVCAFIAFIRIKMACQDPIIIYTGYTKQEQELFYHFMKNYYNNIIIKWGRYLINNAAHYDAILGVWLASDNQYAERIN